MPALFQPLHAQGRHAAQPHGDVADDDVPVRRGPDERLSRHAKAAAADASLPIYGTLRPEIFQPVRARLHYEYFQRAGISRFMNEKV